MKKVASRFAFLLLLTGSFFFVRSRNASKDDQRYLLPVSFYVGAFSEANAEPHPIYGGGTEADGGIYGKYGAGGIGQGNGYGRSDRAQRRPDITNGRGCTVVGHEGEKEGIDMFDSSGTFFRNVCANLGTAPRPYPIRVTCSIACEMPIRTTKSPSQEIVFNLNECAWRQGTTVVHEDPRYGIRTNVAGRVPFIPDNILGTRFCSACPNGTSVVHVYACPTTVHDTDATDPVSRSLRGTPAGGMPAPKGKTH